MFVPDHVLIGRRRCTARVPARCSATAVLCLSVGLSLTGCTQAAIVFEPDVDAGGGVDTGPRPDANLPDMGPAGCTTEPLVGIPPETCRPIRPPARTLCPEEGEDRTIVRALLDPSFARTNGYDLDGYCTMLSGVPNSCMNMDDDTPPDSTEFGTDNAFATFLIPGFEVVDPNIEMRFSDNMRDGEGTPMVELTGWNGTPNDQNLQVVLTISVRPENNMPPAWDMEPTPVLVPAASFYNPGTGQPIAIDREAYVTDGVMVMRIPDNQPFVFQAEGRAVEIRLSDARLTAQIDDEGTLSGALLSGRWSQANANAALDLLVCPSDTLFRPPAEQLIRNAADVRTNPAEDTMMLPCNAISAAIRFDTSAPVIVSTLREETVFEDPCM